MGWGKGGPYRYDGDSLYYLEFPKSDLADTFYAEYPNSSYNPYDIYSWYKDSKGNVWFGTVSLGVCRYDGTSVSWLYEEQLTKTPSGGDFGIRSIVEDKDGYFWFSNSRYRYEILPTSTERNGTDYIDYKRENGVGYSDKNKEIEYPYFMSIVEDNDGNLWLDSDGLWQNNGEQLTPFSIGNRRSNESLISIYKDNNGDLWASVPNDGTYKFNGEAFERFHFEVITK
ncbi:two-component regulator propeller domain-containing protein [Lewinella cohaerens]|uniref:two-component regulator propeller domain-containing protein n=1 Tax=Lewinella cohaerens TaxID=70995 RepID=UPI003CCC0CF4